MKKTILTISSIIFAVSTIFAQDIIYTVSGEINQSKTALDSILVENTANDTRILFGDLPAQDYYQINLSKNAFGGTVGLNINEDAPAFEVAQNFPGMLTIVYRKNTPTEVLLSVYNINGQRVFTPEKKILITGNSINVKLSTSGVFFVRIEAPFGVQTFKTIGVDNVSEYAVEITNQINSRITTKSASFLNNGDFNFSLGDSLLVSVYKNDYYARPIGINVVKSEKINFLFTTRATVETENSTYIKTFSAILNGKVISDGASTITERGFYYGTSQNVESNGTKVPSENGTGTFSKELIGLQPGTIYYYKAYAINGVGIAWGNELTFTTGTVVGSTGEYVNDFTWGNRHGKDWNTLARRQIGGSCVATAATNTLESLANLYFNRKYDPNLSVAQAWFCSNKWGYNEKVAEALVEQGLVDSACFSTPLTYDTYSYPADSVCTTSKCENPIEQIKPESFFVYDTIVSGVVLTEIERVNYMKRLLMTYGPIFASLNSWHHAMELVGFKTIQVGDTLYTSSSTVIFVTDSSELIGKTCWYFKAMDGYGIKGVVLGFASNMGQFAGRNGVTPSVIFKGAIKSLKYPNDSIRCTDDDNDGYFFWGIGPKPAHCPPCPDEPDGDDSNSSLGPMDEYGHCAKLVPTNVP